MLRNIMPGLAVLAGTFWMGPAIVSAQQESPLDQRNQQVDTTEQILDARAQQAELTANLATWLITSNHAQVELGKLAAERTQREEVREYARMMVNDHSQAMKQLQQFTPEQEEFANRNAQSTDPMKQIGQTAARYELGLTQKLLEKFEGQDFDMGYLGQQMVAHVEMLATLEAMKNHGSPEFQQVVQRGIETTKEHYKRNFMLSMKFEDDHRRGVGQTASDVDETRSETQFTPRNDRNDLDRTEPNRFNATPAPLNNTDNDPLEGRPSTDNDLDIRLENQSPERESDIQPRTTIKDDDSFELEAEGDVQP